MKSILKRGKNKEEDYPKKFNGFLEFNHKGIISNSKAEEEKLEGCEISNTLYLEALQKETPISMLLTGRYGYQISSVVNERFSNSLASSLFFGFEDDFPSNFEISSIELPQQYKDSKSLLDKVLKNKTLAFVFLDNNPFILGLMIDVINYIKESKVQPVLLIHLPHDEEEINEEFSCLVFIYNLMKKDASFNIPFLVIDEKYSAKVNSNILKEELRELIYHREANVICDIILSMSNQSIFYQTDRSNFTRIFQDTQGICQLFSFDIYDNNQDISHLLNRYDKACSILSKEKPTRGFVIIQPGKEGLKTKIYQKVRDFYENSDIIISILEKRSNGALLRGIYCFVGVPKSILERYSKLEKMVILLYDEENNIIQVTKEKLFEEALNAKRYEIQIIEESRK